MADNALADDVCLCGFYFMWFYSCFNPNELISLQVFVDNIDFLKELEWPNIMTADTHIDWIQWEVHNNFDH